MVFICSLSYSQEMTYYGFLQNFITLNEQVAAPVGHSDVETSTWGFRIKRAVFGFRSDFNEVFSMSGHIEYAYKDQVTLDIFGTAKIDKYLNLKLGQFIPNTQATEAGLIPTDYCFHQLSDLTLYTATYSGFSSLRDVGLSVYGGNDWFKYNLFVGNGLGRFVYIGDDAQTNASMVRNRKFGQGFYGARLDFYPVKGLRIGGHVGINKQDSIRFSSSKAASDVFYNLDRTMYTAGFETDDILIPGVFSGLETAAGNVKDTDAVPYARNNANGYKIDYYGFHGTLGYKIMKNLHVLARYERYNEDYSNGNYLKNENTLFGLSYFFFKGNKDIIKLELNYLIKTEKPTEVNNNAVVLLVQFKY